MKSLQGLDDQDTTLQPNMQSLANTSNDPKLQVTINNGNAEPVPVMGVTSVKIQKATAVAHQNVRKYQMRPRVKMPDKVDSHIKHVD